MNDPSGGGTALTTLTGGLDWNYMQSADSLYLTVTSAVPEPAAWGALAGLVALAGAATRRPRRS